MSENASQPTVPVQPVYVMNQQSPYAAGAPLPPKSVGVAYIFWLLLGVVGGHQFYMGKIGRGIGYLLTLGWLFVGVFIDLFTMGAQVRAVNARRALGFER
jgi:TM2 domain-containing membrane protein YozV